MRAALRTPPCVSARVIGDQNWICVTTCIYVYVLQKYQVIASKKNNFFLDR